MHLQQFLLCEGKGLCLLRLHRERVVSIPRSVLPLCLSGQELIRPLALRSVRFSSLFIGHPIV
jgi:hypothetical protein